MFLGIKVSEFVFIMVIMAMFAVGLAVGYEKQHDIDSRTYYDKELGRMIYVEKGV